MTFKAFDLERLLSDWEQTVEFNFAESGVHPVPLKELLEFADADLNEFLDIPLNYPEVNGDLKLRQRIQELYNGAGLDNVIVTVGASEANYILANTLLMEGDEVAVMRPTYMQFSGAAANLGAKVRTFSLNENKAWALDIEELQEAVTPNTKAIAVVNPNNPTGTMITLKEVQELAMKIPKQALLVLDGAYAEYVDNYDGGIQLVKNTNNVIMTRTFSKIYGLGGMRVGWGFSSKSIIDALRRVRGPFNLSVPALAVAEAAIEDQDYVEKCKQENNTTRDWLIEKLRKLGLACDSSFTNFVLPRFKNKSQAEFCDRYLQSKGFIVRRVDGYNLPDALRITVGDRSTCENLASVIEEFLVGQK